MRTERYMGKGFHENVIDLLIEKIDKRAEF